MHVGGVRTALFAWLLAKQNDGRFVLRIEDTDQAREVQGSADHIQASLKWLGLEWDEGPIFQSERLDLYKKWADKLVAEGKAYADPYTKEQLDTFREQAKAAKKPFLFRNHRPENPPTWDGTQPLRLKSDPKAYDWHDEVMGDLHAGAEAVDDFILMKSDGFPTYNFAHIIDDHDMGITHVFRSQEFLASVPKYLNLYEALGIDTPKLATLPFVMAPGGKKKLSKRDGAKDLLDYSKQGYLPETLLNFLATLGWNDGTEQETFSRSELLEKFSLTRIQRGGAIFDEQRLNWMNGWWIRSLELDDLYARSAGFWPAEADGYPDDYRKPVLGLVQERLKYLAELPQLTSFFFTDLPPDLSLVQTHKQLKKLDRAELHELLQTAATVIGQSDFSVADLTDKLNGLLETTGQKPAVLFSLIRIATTWAPSSPGLADTLAVLGKERSMQRLNDSLKII